MTELQDAYDRIIGPLEDRMIRSVWRIVADAQDAEDAMQNALLMIWKRWDRVTAHPNPEALILKICIDAAYDVTRRRPRDRHRGVPRSAIEEPPDVSRSPAEQLIQSEIYAEVIAAIHNLSRHQAVAMLMSAIEELNYGQIAAAMECTEATVRKHIARGRERLRGMLAHLEPNKTTRS
jgi:RNA polymerase sigma factor (sigma-70 family)